MLNQKISLDSDNFYLFKYMGIGLLISEVGLFLNGSLKRTKSN